jgi:hypothetical protein
MKSTLIKISLGTILLASFNSVAQEEKPAFVYDVESQITNPNYYSLEVQPLSVGMYGSFMAFGVGAKGRVVGIMDRFSLAVGYTNNYYNLNYNSNQRHMGILNYENVKSSVFDFSVGYMISTRSDVRDEEVTVEKMGNVNIVSDLPVKSFTEMEVRLGHYSMGLFSENEVEIDYTYIDQNSGETGTSSSTRNIFIYQKANNITLGVNKRITAKSVYNTDQYGQVNYSNVTDFFGDLLIGYSTIMPDLYNYVKGNSTYPNEISSVEKLDESKQRQVETAFKKMPIGLRLGYTQNEFKMHGVLWNVQLALNTGHYSSIGDLISFRLGISYRFMQGI